MNYKSNTLFLLSLTLLQTLPCALPALSHPLIAPTRLFYPVDADLPPIPPGPAINQSRYSTTGFLARIAKDQHDLPTAKDKLDLLDHLASLQYTLCQYDQTLATCNKMLALDAKSLNAFWWRSLSYLRQNKFDDALKSLEDASAAQGHKMYGGLQKGIGSQKYDYEHREVDPAKRWALACGAILFAANKNGLNTLTGCDPASNHVEVQRKAILESWGVTTRADLLVLLRRLVDGMHDTSWQKCRNDVAYAWDLNAYLFAGHRSINEIRKIQLVRRYGDEFGDRGIKAWDYCRYICLCRWGAEIGLITDVEAWTLMMPVAAKIQKTYSSWEQMAGEYLVGRDFWAHNLYERDWDKNATDVMWLLKIPTSPWVQLPWDTDLKCKGDDAAIHEALDAIKIKVQQPSSSRSQLN